MLKRFLKTTFTVAIIGGCLTSHQVAAKGHAVTLAGDVIKGEVSLINPSGKVQIGEQSLELESLRFIAPAQTAGEELAPEAEESALRVILVCGSDLRAKDMTFLDENFILNSASVGRELTIPVDSVRAVRLALSVAGSRFEEALVLKADQREEDTVYVTGAAGELLEFNCLLESITADSISFESKGKKEILPRDKIHGVILASPDLDQQMPTRVIMDDRSTFAGKVVSLSGGTLLFKMTDGIEIALPWKSVRRLHVYSSRLQLVSELDPIEIKTQSILAPKWEFRNNLSVEGNPLTIGEEVFEQGLGLAAGMKVTYGLNGEFRLFTATIGIDAETETRGDCEFVILGDGKELFRQRVRGTDLGKRINVDVSQVKKLSICVEAGEGLDLSDHANWAEASLLKGS